MKPTQEFTAIIDSNGRVTIPHYLRQLWQIPFGSKVKLKIVGLHPTENKKTSEKS